MHYAKDTASELQYTAVIFCEGHTLKNALEKCSAEPGLLLSVKLTFLQQ